MTAALPLFYKTPLRWGDQALENPIALLSDHAYLERKAASNALDLLNRWPTPGPSTHWVTTLSGIARDEALHLNTVTRLIKKKKGQIERTHRAHYASDLRELVRKGQGRDDLVDRLLVSSLIEARSFERFDILGKRCKDPDMKKLYIGLMKSEWGHFNVFLKLAESVQPVPVVRDRWDKLREKEADIIQKQPPGSRIHSGLNET